MIKILIADDQPNVGYAIELMVKRSINNEVKIEFKHVNDIVILKEKIEIYKPDLLILDIKWTGVTDENNAGLNFILELSPTHLYFKLLFISVLEDADYRKHVAGLAGFTLIDKSYIDEFSFINIIKAIQLENDSDRHKNLKEDVEKYKTYMMEKTLLNRIVVLYKNATTRRNEEFNQRVLLNDIVCLEGADKYTNIYINNHPNPYLYSQNLSSFIEIKILDKEFFESAFKKYGMKNNLIINKEFIINEDYKNGKSTVSVNANITKKIFTSGY